MVYEQLHNFISLIKIFCLINLYIKCQLIFQMQRKYQSISKISHYLKTLHHHRHHHGAYCIRNFILPKRHVVISNQIANVHDKNN